MRLSRSDFTILVAGEIRDISGEAASRSNIDLPGRQLDLIKAIHATGKPYAVVLKNGRPLTINWVAENSPAILETWHSGTMGGAAVADVLFGDANPSGKLPVTFPRSVGQIPLYYNHKSTGRPLEPENRYTSKYVDVPNTPLYPFGYGLSYTQFRIGDIRLDKTNIPISGSIRGSAEVENIGKRSGDEIVQIYIQDVASSVTRPVRELKGFRRISLNPGEKRRVEFMLTSKELGTLDRNLKFAVEPGEFRVFIGDSSDATLQTSFTVGPVARAASVDPPRSTGATSMQVDNAIPAAGLTGGQRVSRGPRAANIPVLLGALDPFTGLALDRSKTDGTPPQPGQSHYRVASIASTGFGLTGLCIAADRGWIKRRQAVQRAKNTLDFFANRALQENGWFYHWMDAVTGERRWNSEISSIDTALLLGGVLSVKNVLATTCDSKTGRSNLPAG